MKKEINKRYMLSLIAFVIIFLGFTVYLVYFQTFKSKSIADSEYNPRLYKQPEDTIRGDIYDNKGNLVAYSKLNEDDEYERIYPYAETNANITGYFSKIYGTTGLESSYNELLSGKNNQNENELINRMTFNEDGADIYLTLDQEIQNIAFNQLKGKKGSIVVLDPKTGKVLALTSYPSYNPNDIEDKWEEISNKENGPLLNRATQASYRPGSTMKIVTASGILKYGLDERYNDTGYEVIKSESQYQNGQDFTVTNFKNYSYGNIDLYKAFTYSVNTYFANKAMTMGWDLYNELTNSFLFNTDYDFDLPNIGGKIPYNELTPADLAMTSFGYGKTEVSPLHMAMVASAIANDGVIMQPYLVEKAINRDGETIREKSPINLSQALDVNSARYIRDLMIDTVDNGFNDAAKVNGVEVAGKTGTVENTNGLNDAWFVGFAPAKYPKYAIAVVIEDVDGTGSDYATPVAGKVLRNLFKR